MNASKNTLNNVKNIKKKDRKDVNITTVGYITKPFVRYLTTDKIVTSQNVLSYITRLNG